MTPRAAHVWWLFGLSGAGKSTLAERLAAELRGAGTALLRLDGDQLRGGLCQGLGYSDADRAENLRRAAEVAKLACASGLDVVASFITPAESHRRLVCSILGPDVSFVFVQASLETCRARDVKGLYARAAAGQLAGMTGMGAPFETPQDAAVAIVTDAQSVDQSFAELWSVVSGRRRGRSSP